ncbi:MAG: DUF1800 family protein, partial [Bacteroidota bacterium]
TEADITTAARVLTGWVIDKNRVDPDTGILTGRPVLSRHDQDDKTFGSAFQNTTIIGATSEDDMYRELQDFVDMIFNQIETARSFVRKMYRFFVKDIIDSDVETDIIQPLADDLYNNDYDHILVLKKLLKSRHFYDVDDKNTTNEIIGGKIKSPLELFCTTVNLLNITNSKLSDLEYSFYREANRVILTNHFSEAGMSLNGPETVEGYPGYYDQTAGYSRAWFKTNILFQRYSYGTSFKRGKVRNTNRNFPYQMDIISWTENNLDDVADSGTPTVPQGAADAYHVVDSMLDYFIPERPVDSRYSYFLQALLGGLSPVNWYFSWREYLDTGETANVKVGLERLYDAIMASPEFQTF